MDAATLHETTNQIDPREIREAQQMIIVYHAGCHDGFCCAWLLHHIYPDAEFLPFQYGMDPPEVDGRDVIVADFSFPVRQMLHMESVAKSMIVFDHHKSVDDLLKNRPWFYFDLSLIHI